MVNTPNGIDASLNPELNEHQIQVHVDAMKDTFGAQLRAATLSTGEAARSVEKHLHYALSNFLHRPDADPEMVDLLDGLLGELGNISAYGDSQSPLSSDAKNDIRGVLIGARMALQMRRDRQSKPDPQPKEHTKDVRHFVDLVQKRVGHTEPNGDAVLNMVVHPDQSGGTVTYKKK